MTGASTGAVSGAVSGAVPGAVPGAVQVLDGADAALQASAQRRASMLSQADALVCTMQEASPWLVDSSSSGVNPQTGAPELARRLRAAGAGAVCIVSTDLGSNGAHCWLDSEHARGWLSAAHGNAPLARARFAADLAAAMTRGFVAADAAVIATMAGSAHARRGNAADFGDYIRDRTLLPRLSWGERPDIGAGAAAGAVGITAPAGAAAATHKALSSASSSRGHRLDLYAIVDSADRVLKVLAAGIRTVQLRIKTDASTDANTMTGVREQVQRTVAACRAANAELFINDHWRLASDAGAGGVHLGQEDLLALGDEGRAQLLSRGLALGISSHSLWELCRAATLRPRYIACGPVWPTLTKAMPWQAQGLDNLAWWCAMAPAPVVAIGGILEADKVRQAASCGADGVCIVRGLGEDPGVIVPALQQALVAGRRDAPAGGRAPAPPHPSLSFEVGKR